MGMFICLILSGMEPGGSVDQANKANWLHKLCSNSSFLLKEVGGALSSLP